MNLQTSRTQLLSACQAVASAVPASTTKPELKCLKLSASGNVLTLTATDTEIGIRLEIQADSISRPGECLLPADRITKILSNSDAPDVTIRADDTAVSVRLGGTRYDLPSFDPNAFPDVPATTSEAPYQLVNSNELRAAIERVAMCAERREAARWAVTGIAFEPHGNYLRLVATDTKRLALTTITAECTEQEPESKIYLIPVKACNVLSKNLDAGPQCKVILRPNAAMFVCGDATIHTRLVEGKFPPYQQIIPKKLEHAVTMPVDGFFTAIRQASITSEADSPRVDLAFSDGLLSLSSSGQDIGKSEIDFPVNWGGASAGFALDSKHTLDARKGLQGCDKFTLQFTDADKPVLIVADNYTHLIMPLGQRGE